MVRIFALISLIVLQSVMVQISYAKMLVLEDSTQVDVFDCHGEPAADSVAKEKAHCQAQSLCCINLLSPVTLILGVDAKSLVIFLASAFHQKPISTHFSVFRPPQN